jgi:small conductance mechanosensitive channel
MILIYRPYDVGDIIESGGVVGRVNNMSFVNTTIITFDNQSIIIPNSKIWNDVIKNVTSQTHRRVDMAFGIAYNDNIEKAETVLMQIMKDHDKILDEPEPIVKLHELGDSSVNFIVRPWVLKEDYWEVYWDVTRTVKLKFDEAGLSIPFPQRDVHLYSQGSGVD